MKPLVIMIVGLGLGAGSVWAGPGLNLPGHNNPRPSRPQRMSGGEGFPPLPLPVTPLRRSEKKREPSPPVLVAKLTYARQVYNVTNDVRKMLHWAGRTIGISYRPATFRWHTFSYDPTEIPILYLTGHDPIGRLPAANLRRLRQYLYGGGALIANACCGAVEFTESFRQLVADLFPDRPLRRLSADHPLFWCREKVQNVQYQQGRGRLSNGPARLEGVDIGCRTVVIFAPSDLANGWYGQMPPGNFPQGSWILRDDARKLGVNILTYLLGSLQYARSLPITQVQYRTAAQPGEALTIGQLVHGGDWDPNPSALQRLQRYLTEHSTIPVTFKRAAADPGDRAIFGYPIAYMVGHRNFSFTDKQIGNLRQYLQQGGVLLAEACCGRKAFDLAFRREIGRVLPDHELAAVRPDHDLYRINFKVVQPKFTELAGVYYPDLKGPHLQAVEMSGRLAVIYSPLALGNGWEGIPHPFSAGYADVDASRLGVNVFVYVLSH